MEKTKKLQDSRIFQIVVLSLVGVALSLFFRKMLLPIIGMIFFIGLILWDGRGETPSSIEMVENYQEHKVEFHQLIDRIQEDKQKGLEVVSRDFTRPEDVSTIGLTSNDVKSYRATLSKLGMTGFVAYSFTNDITLPTKSWGLSIGGGSIGYLYSLEPQTNYLKNNDCGQSQLPVEDIDDFQKCNANSYEVYQKIDENWYVFKSYED